MNYIMAVYFRLLAVFLLIGMAFGCSASNNKAEYIDESVEFLYNKAMDSAAAGKYRTAAPLFDEVERQHPYSVWATQAQLMAAYSLYQSNQYDEAVNALDRFIQLNPSNKNTDYAYYLKGLSFYERIIDVGRDQEITRKALETFNEIIKRFPDSSYARDAGLKIGLNNLAKLQEQQRREEAARQSAASAMQQSNIESGTGGYQSDFAQDSDFMGGSGTAAEMGSF